MDSTDRGDFLPTKSFFRGNHSSISQKREWAELKWKKVLGEETIVEEDSQGEGNRIRMRIIE